jgi:hypothetical protein
MYFFVDDIFTDIFPTFLVYVIYEIYFCELAHFTSVIYISGAVS